MRKTIYTIITVLLLAAGVWAAPQPSLLSVGSSGFTIKNGTVFSVKGLVLSPSSDVTITNNSINFSGTAVTNGSDQSISLAYTFTSPLSSYSGLVGIQYSVGELNGNTESDLQIAYNPLSSGGSFVVSSSSNTGSAGSYYVSNTLNSVNLGVVTALPTVSAPVATTNAATSITSSGAILNGSVNANGSSTTVTFEYGITTSYGTIVTADESLVTGSSATSVSKAITGLTANTIYHYRVVGENTGGTTNGQDQTFTTGTTTLTESFYEQITLPFAPTDDVDMSSSTLAPTMNLVSVNGSYPSKGYKVTLIKSGTITLFASSNEITTSHFAFLVSTSYDASLSSKKYFKVGNGTTATLTPGTYYIVLFTDNMYGKFKLNITFAALPNITSISPTSGTTAGGTTVTITGTDFTNATAVKFGSTAATSFTVNSDTQITATSPASTSGTVHITVTTAGGTSATGSADQFTYEDTPTAITNAATSITSSGATLNGTINAKGASTTVTFEYGLTTSYGTTVTADQSPVTGSTTTLVSKAITGLAAGTTYHYRVVGANANETTNGDDMTFTTLKLPSVTTQAVSSISTNSAVANGNITDLGQPNPTAYGFCWSTSPNPTTDNSKIDKGSISEAGAFSATLTGLETHTKYYVRAYSINEAGTSYGEQVSFSTKGIIANVILYEIKDIESTSAIGKCSITDFGFPNATAYGICWSTSPNPTMFNSKIHNLGAPTTIGFFYASLTELEPNTVYYARVYAANAEGIAYSYEISFKTTQSNPVITWSNPSDISYGTALNDLQLNATSTVEGTFEYTPAAGTKLNVGDAQELSVTFTPNDLAKNKIVNKTVQINVRKAVPVITWENPKDIVNGTALSDLQLNAVANIEGTFVYNPIAGTVMNTGDLQELTVQFSPADTEHYSATSDTVKINVVIKTGIDPEKQNSISIYPNPTTDKFYITGIEDQTTIRISSLNGKLISEKKVANHEAISVQNLPAGTYLIGITNKEAMTCYKLVKK
ncbi:IPT/TIG domain-containing protein [Aquipluma nitroreducens]|nr:IPT/TIG domain-containing protein [Aquipluma nitroreducens]